MPSIKINVLLALSQNEPWIDINTLDIQVYYGDINDNNFYKATPIDFTNFKNDGLILYFTVGIFTKAGKNIRVINSLILIFNQPKIFQQKIKLV
ncbi:hypothetical protein P344_01460 [Spiroplasma mirum ATCC 29335]|uniref:Uncharacterized protein n=1 Tax=Spiroplasma mirum ATCC 29335 TaxID=838561 RepID=W0GKB8_9MOLU|nr:MULTISPECIES: hypothetical protein [Spiroplasma]AHF60690.1 hypothetical protein SMM_0239 [Spiroplasma mirum ATCC 29335]AHI57657.1 hypothetical protein P344_01460 [Spiroplasma mirum ATCC 29335]